MSRREDAHARPPRVLVPDLAEHLARFEEHEEISLKVEEREHVRSRRLRDGDEVVAIDGKGARARRCSRGAASAVALLPSKKIFSSSSSSSSFSSLPPGEPANRVVVALACAEPARVEWAIEKGTECGAAGFVLLDAERSQKLPRRGAREEGSATRANRGRGDEAVRPDGGALRGGSEEHRRLS